MPAAGEPFRIERYRDSDRDQTLALYDRALGQGYIGEPQLFGDCEGADFDTLVVRDGERLVGAASFGIGGSDAILTVGVPEAVRSQVRNLLPLQARSARVGLLHALAVYPEAQGMGAGSDLCVLVRDRLLLAGATLVVALAWTDAAGCHAAKPLSRAGFRRVGQVERAWYEESLRSNSPCPSCGIPCVCAADIYLWL
jgi:GNAT superfamily N-acetyltransferase